MNHSDKPDNTNQNNHQSFNNTMYDISINEDDVRQITKDWDYMSVINSTFCQYTNEYLKNTIAHDIYLIKHLSHMGFMMGHIKKTLSRVVITTIFLEHHVTEINSIHFQDLLSDTAYLLHMIARTKNMLANHD
jgi:hypothetical protein